MARRIRQVGCLLALFALSGCAAIFGPHELPPDPLFANRKPVEAKTISAPPVVTSYSEPVPPAHP
jgi:predicted small lipoprotein YifL